jgi:hypothetical protein
MAGASRCILSLCPSSIASLILVSVILTESQL